MPLIADIAYFKELKLKPYELNEVCSGLEYKAMTKDSFVIRYGEEGDLFYIILKGKVSVWVPVSMEEMRRPMKRLQDNIKNGSHVDQPNAFKFTKNILK